MKTLEGQVATPKEWSELTGEFLRNIMERNNLTLSSLRHLGDKAYVSRIRSGKVSPSQKFIEGLATVTGESQFDMLLAIGVVAIAPQHYEVFKKAYDSGGVWIDFNYSEGLRLKWLTWPWDKTLGNLILG